MCLSKASLYSGFHLIQPAGSASTQEQKERKRGVFFPSGQREALPRQRRSFVQQIAEPPLHPRLVERLGHVVIGTDDVELAAVDALERVFGNLVGPPRSSGLLGWRGYLVRRAVPRRELCVRGSGDDEVRGQLGCLGKELVR
jgi:hypothetical protein